MDGVRFASAASSVLDCLPEVVRGVAVGDQEDRDCGVVLGGVDAVGAAGVVFLSVGGQRLEQGFTAYVSKMAALYRRTRL